jgi:hypothetical protein
MGGQVVYLRKMRARGMPCHFVELVAGASPLVVGFLAGVL